MTILTFITTTSIFPTFILMGEESGTISEPNKMKGEKHYIFFGPPFFLRPARKKGVISRAFRRAWDVGPRALEGTSRNVAWELGSGAAWFDRPLGCLLGLSVGPFCASWALLERLRTCTSDACSVRKRCASGGLWVAIGGVLKRSWGPLGALLDSFKGLLGANRLPEEAQKAPKSGPRGDSSSKRDFLKKYVFSI